MYVCPVVGSGGEERKNVPSRGSATQTCSERASFSVVESCDLLLLLQSIRNKRRCVFEKNKNKLCKRTPNSVLANVWSKREDKY
jgi:hypothetical protein